MKRQRSGAFSDVQTSTGRIEQGRTNQHVFYIACAGHGKTTWVTNKIIELIADENVAIQDIIAFSFTNTAADTLRGKLQEKGYEIDVSTMHAWCNGFTSRMTTSRPVASSCVCTMIREVLALKTEQHFTQLVSDYKPRKYIFIDEAQDCNVDQFELVYFLQKCWQSNIIMVGDDAQSIFGFQGAQPSEFLSFPFKPDWEEQGVHCDIIEKRENYRSTEEIINVINANQRHIENSKPLLCVTGKHGPMPTIGAYTNGDDEIISICSNVAQLIQDGTRGGEIAILCRNNAGLQPYCFELMSKHGVDVSLSSDDIKESLEQTKVNLRTCHSAKGCDWKIVFVPGMNDYENENMEEERRLFHVAISRAQHSLHVSYSSSSFSSRYSCLSRFISQSDIIHYRDLYETDRIHFKPIVFFDPLLHPSTVQTYRKSRHADLEISIDNDIATMELVHLRELLVNMQETTPRVPVEAPTSPIQALVQPPPCEIQYHGMSSYFSNVMKHYSKILLKQYEISKHSMMMQPTLSLSILPKSIAELVLLPPCKKSILDSLKSDPQCSIPIPSIIQQRTQDIIDSTFEGNTELYEVLKKDYGITEIARPWVQRIDKYWDIPTKKGILEMCKHSFIKLHIGLHENRCSTKMCKDIMYCFLLIDFIAFARACEPSGDYKKGNFSIDRCCNSPEFLHISEYTRQVTMNLNANITKTTSHLENTSKSIDIRDLSDVSIEDRLYTSIFDYRDGDKFYMLDYEPKNDEVDDSGLPIPVNRLFAALLCTQHVTGTIYYNFVNIATQSVKCFVSMEAQRKEISHKYVDRIQSKSVQELQ